MIEDNILLYEEKLKSPIRRFIDKSFVPVRYFHIKSNDTTVDKGWQDVEEILGKSSPIKFQKIDNLPLYGLETLMLQLQTTDQGLDTSFESEATIMAGTIIPLENDYFMITHLKDSYIFRVTSVDYDSISSVPCYKIGYILEYIDNEKAQDLENQTKAEFTCILENIGTDERCIIEKDLDLKLKAIDEMYAQIADTYLTFYYNERYNCLLGDFGNGLKLFDPFQIEFINRNKIFTRKRQIDSLFMTEQFEDPRRKIKYQKSIYHFFETQRMEFLSNFDYTVFPGMNNKQTSFYRWLDRSIMIVDIPKMINPTDHYSVMTDLFMESIRLNGPIESKWGKLIQAFARKEEITPNDIDLGLADEIMLLDDANLEVFFYTPIILYILKDVISKQLTTEFES